MKALFQLLHHIGVWDEIDVMHCCNATYSPTSWAVNFYRQNWKDPTKHLCDAEVGKEPSLWVSGSGFKIDASNEEYIKSGFTPSLHATKATLNDWSEIIGVFDVPTTHTSTSVWFGVKSVDDVNNQCLMGNATTGQVLSRLGSADIKSVSQSQINGHYHIIRQNIGSVTVRVFKDGVNELNSVYTTTPLSIDLPSDEVYLFTHNDQGVPLVGAVDFGIKYKLTGSALLNERLDIFNILNIISI